MYGSCLNISYMTVAIFAIFRYDIYITYVWKWLILTYKSNTYDKQYIAISYTNTDAILINVTFMFENRCAEYAMHILYVPHICSIYKKGHFCNILKYMFQICRNISRDICTNICSHIG